MSQVAIPFSLHEGLQKSQIGEFVNNSLASIKADILQCNGFVDLQSMGDGHYVLVARCDNETVRQQMQELINNEISKRMKKAA